MNKAMDGAVIAKDTNEHAHAWFGAKLMSGGFGLAKTFWGFGVLANGAYRLLSRLLDSEILILCMSLVFLAYFVMVLIGLFRAAANYTGPRAYKEAAKFIGAVWIFSLAVGLIRLL